MNTDYKGGNLNYALRIYNSFDTRWCIQDGVLQVMLEDDAKEEIRYSDIKRPMVFEVKSSKESPELQG